MWTTRRRYDRDELRYPSDLTDEERCGKNRHGDFRVFLTKKGNRTGSRQRTDRPASGDNGQDGKSRRR